MNYGYFLQKEYQTNTSLVGQQLLDNGAECFLFDDDIDNLESNYPKWAVILSFLKKGDKLIVHEIDDIFLSPIKLIKLFNDFKQRDIGFVSLKENLKFNQGCHNFFDIISIYEIYKKSFYGVNFKRKGALLKRNNEPKKPRRNMTDQVKGKAIAIADDYKKGLPIPEILSKYTVCGSTMYAYLNYMGVDRRKSRNMMLNGFEDEKMTIENIVSQYELLKSIPKVATFYPTLSKIKIRKVLISQGVEINGRGRRNRNVLNNNPNVDIEKAITMYRKDELVPTIVKECNFPSRSILLQALKERNVEIRPVGWSRSNHYNKIMVIDKAITLYQNGELVPIILKKCNMPSRIKLLKILKEHNVEIRQVGWSRTNSKRNAMDIDKAISMYQNGDFMPTILKACNISNRNKLLEILKKQGVQIRGVGRPRKQNKG